MSFRQEFPYKTMDKWYNKHGLQDKNRYILYFIIQQLYFILQNENMVRMYLLNEFVHYALSGVPNANSYQIPSTSCQ